VREFGPDDVFDPAGAIGLGLLIAAALAGVAIVCRHVRWR
jgi:hypothetical protein